MYEPLGLLARETEAAQEIDRGRAHLYDDRADRQVCRLLEHERGASRGAPRWFAN